MDIRPKAHRWISSRLAVGVMIGATMIGGAVSLAGPAWADIFTPHNGATVALPTTVSGSGTAGLEIYVAAISQQAGREVTHCSTTVDAAGNYSCAIPAVPQRGRFDFVIHQFPAGLSPTPMNTFDQVSVTVVDALPVTPAGHPVPFVVAGLMLVVGGLGLLLQVRYRRRRLAAPLPEISAG